MNETRQGVKTVFTAQVVPPIDEWETNVLRDVLWALDNKRQDGRARLAVVLSPLPTYNNPEPMAHLHTVEDDLREEETEEFVDFIEGLNTGETPEEVNKRRTAERAQGNRRGGGRGQA